MFEFFAELIKLLFHHPRLSSCGELTGDEVRWWFFGKHYNLTGDHMKEKLNLRKIN
jgi:hypothetical protein